MGWSPCEVHLPVGVLERMRQHCSQITTYLNPEAVRSVLDGVTLEATHRAKGYDPAVVEGDCGMEKEVCVATGWVISWNATWLIGQKHRERTQCWTLCWTGWKPKKTDLKILLGEHASSKEADWFWGIIRISWFTKKTLYLCSMPKGENEYLLLFVVPKPYWVTILNGCH